LVCTLKLTAYMPDHLHFTAYFARYAAHAFGLPCSDIMHPKEHIQRWVMNKGHFIHAKTKEEFERRTYYAVLQIFDGDAEVVRKWVDYVRINLPAGIDLE
ncbi:ribosomal protein S10 domain-containing protein, partial [Blyttiomyces helicus]